ncbi:MAG: TonB-dependent receptor plug domain-containing protein, partial [Ferruginibacter sp.]
MKKLIPILLFFPLFSKAQNTFIAVVKNEDTKTALPGVTVTIKNLKILATTNEAGLVVIADLPAGKQIIEFAGFGFVNLEREFTFPLQKTDTIPVILTQGAQDLDEITISSTRSNRRIGNTPTRVEVLTEDEVHEEATMRPGDIRMLLSESTGIQTQQTSATSASASIRIQGLDGRYTQILKDGFPVYSGAAGDLGLLQTPPLDLRQVEIIKGASSTLFGGGAIAGLVNLVTKIPKD